MAVNSIKEDVAAFTLQPLKPVVSSDHSAKVTPTTNNQTSNVKATSSDGDTTANNAVSPVIKKTPESSLKSKPVLMISDIVMVYNNQGQVRIKFMDSNSHVIYQIPSEMLAKMEDQMMKPETHAAIKG